MSEQKELKIVINDFEGPLDVLLHLIKETKMNIQDVSMLVIVDQYLAFIKQMEVVQLDIAGEYLVMAATLLEMKSRLLLPRVETIVEDSQEEPIMDFEALKLQLIEYQQFKMIAQTLKEKEVQRGQLFAKQPSNLESLQESVPLQQGEVALEDVLQAMRKMFEKQAKQQPIQATIGLNAISVEETMQTILDTLQSSQTDGLALESVIQTREQLIPSFLAMLELAKTKKIIFKQSTPYLPIRIFPGETFNITQTIEITSGV